MSSNLEKDKKLFKIIVVDDNNLARKTISSILESEGYTIAGEASTPEKAIYLAKINPAHLYIIDIVMANKSGIELTKELMEFSNQKWVILISSLTTDHIMIEAISSGASDFLKKPFSKDDLIRAVEKVFLFAKSEKVF